MTSPKHTARVWILAVLSLTAATASFLFHQADYPLTYDEGDYYIAAQRGFLANWADSDDISIVEFAEKGLGAIGDRQSRAELSDYIRNSGSTMLHRHYHPPGAIYPAILLRPFVGNLPLRHQLRYANLFWIYLWIAVLTAVFLLCRNSFTPFMPLLPSSAAFAMAGVGFNMHLPFGLMISLFFYFWYRYGIDRSTVMKRLAQLFLAVALICVEYGMFVLFFLALWLLFRLRSAGTERGDVKQTPADDRSVAASRKALLREAGISALWVLLFVALLWPAGVIKLNMLKSWAFVIYISMFRLGAEPAAFGGFMDILLSKWNSSLPELAMLPAFLLLLIWKWKSVWRQGSLVVACGFCIALLYLQTNPALVYRWYLFPAFAIAFLPFAAWSVRQWPSLRRWTGMTAVTLLSAVMFIVGAMTVEKPVYDELKEIHGIVSSMEAGEIVLPRSIYPQLRPYYPDRRFRSYHDLAFGDMSIRDSLPQWTREAMVILPAGVELGDDVVISQRTENYLFIAAR